MNGGKTGILQRKLRPAQVEEAQPYALVDQAWRLALARALREGAGLAAETTGLTSRACDLVELPELPPERALLALLDGPGGAMGMAALSPELTASVIEMQTIGRLGSGPPAARRPTRTDAAMVSPVLDRALSRFDFLIRDLPERGVGDGYRFASLLDDTRSIGLLLEDLPYHLIRATLSLADGTRQGEMLLALPLETRTEPQQQAARGPQETAFAADLGQTECELQAVLGQRMFTLSEVIALEPGQLLNLNDASLAKVSLRGIDGTPVAIARLGQQNGHRALRISALTLAGSGAGSGDHLDAPSGSAPEYDHGASPDFATDGLTMAQATEAGGLAADAGFPAAEGFGFEGGGDARILA